MSTLRVNNIQSFTSADPVTINDSLKVTGSSTFTGSVSILATSWTALDVRGGVSTFSGGITGSGDLTMSGSLTTTGNSELGNRTLNQHKVTGSLSISGSTNLTGLVTVKDSLIVTGSVILQQSAGNSNTIIFGNLLPTSSLGLSTGQLYRTGSSLDEIKIKL